MRLIIEEYGHFILAALSVSLLFGIYFAFNEELSSFMKLIILGIVGD